MAKIRKPRKPRAKKEEYDNVPELIRAAYRHKEILDDNQAWQGIIRSASPAQKARYKADGIDLHFYRGQAGAHQRELRILHQDIRKALGTKAYRQLGLGKMPHSKFQLYRDNPKAPNGYEKASYLRKKKK